MTTSGRRTLAGRAAFWRASLRQAMESLLSHRLRTFLTALGIMFGVAAVIAMQAIGRGAEAEAVEQIKAFGINNVRIRSVGLERREQRRYAQQRSKGLSYEDARYIQEVLPYVVAMAPQNLLEKPVAAGQEAPQAMVVGTTPDYPRVVGLRLERGRFLAPDDLAYYRKVCVLGHGVMVDAFLGEDPLGKSLTVGGVRFKVVGVMADREATKEKVRIKTRDVNRDVYLPITTSLERFTMLRDEIQGVNQVAYGAVDEIALQVDRAGRLRETRLTLEKILRRRHQGAPDTEVVVPDELLAQSQETQRLFNLVMGFIAGLSLLVGGIGIMNIMLATVTERTREIGLRRAVGASAGDIRLYFLVEAVLICVGGGLLGVVLGFGLAAGISQYAGWRTIISPGSVLLACGVATATGLFFGLFPAHQAARLDPITALRYE